MPQNAYKAGRYFEASLAVPRSIHELISDYIIGNFAGGIIFEEEDHSDLIGLKFYVPESLGLGFRKNLSAYINSLESQSDFQESGIRVKVIEEMEWIQDYRNSVKPIIIDNVIIRPPWENIEDPDLIDLIIEPKMAFGTGRHETTRLCIREMLKYFKKDQSFFDLGCGSGILSILAARLGGNRIRAADIDQAAVDNCIENAAINKVKGKIEVSSGSIAVALNDTPYDFMAANLIKDTIINLYDDMSRVVKKSGILLLSGLKSNASVLYTAGKCTCRFSRNIG
jgi:ribosomal protein L11 methyltransferase